MTEKQVKVYSTPACPYCKLAKSFLDENNIPYEDLDVAEDKAARDEMIDKTSSMSVPVITIGDDYVIGFDQAKLKEKLGLS